MTMWSDIMSSCLGRGLVLTSLLVLLTALLDLASWSQVQKLRKKTPGLYRSAIISNLVNNLVLGPITYYLTVTYIVDQDTALSTLDRLGSILGIVIVEGVLYYLLHKACHEVKGLYWIHRYHHKFNTFVVPSSANAVSVAEYTLLYMIPMVIGIIMTRADEFSAVMAVGVIGITNLLIHTPAMSSQRYFWIFVSTEDHLDHHRKNKSHYGAPVIHMDRILSSFSEAD